MSKQHPRLTPRQRTSVNRIWLANIVRNAAETYATATEGTGVDLDAEDITILQDLAERRSEEMCPGGPWVGSLEEVIHYVQVHYPVGKPKKDSDETRFLSK